LLVTLVIVLSVLRENILASTHASNPFEVDESLSNVCNRASIHPLQFEIRTSLSLIMMILESVLPMIWRYLSSRPGEKTNADVVI